MTSVPRRQTSQSTTPPVPSKLHRSCCEVRATARPPPPNTTCSSARGSTVAASSTTTISCCCCHIGPLAPRKESSAGGRRPLAPAGVSVSSHALRRACVAAAACAVIGMASGGGDIAFALAPGGDAITSRTDAVAVGTARATPRWSDRRDCPPWRANSLENIVPENLPRPSAHRRLDNFSVSAAEGAAAAPDLVAPPSFLALRPGTAGCFSL